MNFGLHPGICMGGVHIITATRRITVPTPLDDGARANMPAMSHGLKAPQPLLPKSLRERERRGEPGIGL